jgi:hypothetical protein
LNGAGGEVKVGYIDVHMGNLTEALQTAAGNFLGGLAGMAFSDVQLKSSDYVMPINNNIDVVLNNIKFSTPYDIAFLAGSTLLVDKQSEVVINNGANVYLYDADENRLPSYKGTNEYGAGTGYFSAGNFSLCPITYLPNGGVQQTSNATTNVLRKSKDVKDAMWIVDGKVTVNGGFYTTDGKAQIVSNTKGKVQFTSNLTDKTTIQAKYKGGGGSALLTGGVDGVHERVYYTVHSAQLKNADNTWVDTKNTTATYTYNPVKGKWETGSVTADLQGSDMLVTLPDYDVTTDAIDPYKSDVVLTGTGMSSAQISWDGGATYTIEYRSDGSYTEYHTGTKGEKWERKITVNKKGQIIKIKDRNEQIRFSKFDKHGNWLLRESIQDTSSKLGNIITTIEREIEYYE